MSTATKPAKAPKSKPAAPRVDPARVAGLFKVASDPTRVAILVLLVDRNHYVNELCDALDVPQSLMSSHLGILRHSGVAETRRVGQRTYYSITETGKRLVAAIVHVAT